MCEPNIPQYDPKALRRSVALDQAIAHRDSCWKCLGRGAHYCEVYLALIKMGEEQ